MLSLAEETTLLLYLGIAKPDGTRSYDVFGRYSGSYLLVAGAVLMDLALRGRVRMDPPKAPEERARRQSFNPVRLLILAALFFGPPLAIHLLVSVLHTFPPGVPVILIEPPAFIVGLVLAVVVLTVIANRRAGTLAIVDISPTGEGLLDSTLQGMARIGRRASLRVYLRREFRMRWFAAELGKLRARLAAEGLVSDARRDSLMLRLTNAQIVNREHPEFVALGQRVRSALLGSGPPDLQTAALACLFSHEARGIALGRRGTRPLYGLYQFFHEDEYASVKTRLAQIRCAGDPALVAQLGSDVYDTLLAVAYAVQDRRTELSSSSAG